MGAFCRGDTASSYPLTYYPLITAREARARDTTGAMAKLQDELGVSMEEGGRLLVAIIEESTRATHGGQFVNIDGTRLPW